MRLSMFGAGFVFGTTMVVLFKWLPFGLWLIIMTCILMFGINFHEGLKK